jgi:hypothetical protein
MKTINRTLLIVLPKQPFLDWVNRIERQTPDFIPATEHQSAYLIPEKYDESNYKTFLKKAFRTIFEEELYSEFRDSNLWPEKRDLKTFNQWFDVHACDIVYDLGKESIITEEL